MGRASARRSPVINRTAILPPRYANARPIAHGGMGRIYLADDSELGRKVAVKLLDDRFASNEPLRQRFKREALTAARLSGHPHVVTIYDVGEWADRPFIVMEYRPGGTVGERTRGEAVTPEQALTWVGQAADALDAAHELGIVHRDVKPANLLLDERDEVAVGDFGIARIADDPTGGMTATGTVLGTAGYLAPEQALGHGATTASDRYGLGVVGYELLTGSRPFERGSETAEAAAHIHEPVPPASTRNHRLSPAVDRVFERALAKDPNERFPTAGTFVTALRDALEGGEATTRLLPAAAPRPTTARHVRRAPPPRSRRPWAIPLLIAGLVAAIAAGLVAAVLTSGDDRPSKSNEGRVTVTAQETVGSTVVTTTVVTTTATPPNQLTLDQAVALTDQATALLRDERWEDALRTQRRALKTLEGTYSDDFRYEAYAAYNMGKALAELGRCEQALRYLDRSEELQGDRREIDEARARCEDENQD
jgi:eukaryotic-like serine/threonine-protein kinase